jgi:hypothetical protein
VCVEVGQGRPKVVFGQDGVGIEVEHDVARGLPKPRFVGEAIQRTSGKCSGIHSLLPSVEALSTTITSTSSPREALRTERRHWSRKALTL